jgi:hypothetical protein
MEGSEKYDRQGSFMYKRYLSRYLSSIQSTSSTSHPEALHMFPDAHFTLTALMSSNRQWTTRDREELSWAIAKGVCLTCFTGPESVRVRFQLCGSPDLSCESLLTAGYVTELL